MTFQNRDQPLIPEGFLDLVNDTPITDSTKQRCRKVFRLGGLIGTPAFLFLLGLSIVFSAAVYPL